MTYPARTHKAMQVRRAHPFQQFGQSDDESTRNGADGWSGPFAGLVSRLVRSIQPSGVAGVLSEEGTAKAPAVSVTLRGSLSSPSARSFERGLPIAVRLGSDVVTGSALSPGPLHPSVRGCELVAPLAVDLPSVDSGRAQPTQSVDLGGDGVQMLWTDAAPVPAQMVEGRSAFGERSYQRLVGPSVRHPLASCRAAAGDEPTVSPSVDRGRPQPARLGLVDLAPEAFGVRMHSATLAPLAVS